MWTTELVVSLLPRCWPYQPWAPDDCKQRLLCRNIQNLARCHSRRSQIELLLHPISKGNEPWPPAEPVLTGSLVLISLPTAQEWGCPKRDQQCSLWSETFSSTLRLIKHWGFSSHIAWVIIFKSFFGGREWLHLVSVRTANSLPQALAQRKCE